MFATWKHKVIVVGAMMMLLGGVLAGAVFAKPPDPPGRSDADHARYHELFFAKLAAALQLDQAAMETAVKQAAKDTIDQAVANGDLAAEQAQRAKSRIDDQGIAGLHPFGRGMKRGGHAAVASLHRLVVDAAAAKLGMSVDDLSAQIRAGKSLRDIANEKGVSAADLRAAVVTAAKAKLDEEVKAGRLTQERANVIIQHLEQMDWMGLHSKMPRERRSPMRSST